MILSRHSIFLCILLIAKAVGKSWSEQLNDRLGDRVSTGGFVDTDSCYNALYEADKNGDSKISSDEYVTVVQKLGPPGFAEDATSLDDLSRQLRQAFNLLACLCTIDGEDNQCCVGDNAHISNAGTAPGETPTSDQEVYLFSVCLTTKNAIDRTVGTSAPTISPSLSPTRFTASPTVEPSSTPSPVPVTIAPTSVAPSTTKPVTLSPTSTSPVTRDPTSFPVTKEPSTSKPVTAAPTSFAPLTLVPTSPAPVSKAPTSRAPFTKVPTTPAPITKAPTSLAPMTKAPTTLAPVSNAPTPFRPSSFPFPSTAIPVSVAPSAPSTTAGPIISSVPTTFGPATVPSVAPTSSIYPVFVEYDVAYRSEDQTGVVDDLNEAMDVLAGQVAAESFPEYRVRRLNEQRRRLSVDVASTNVTSAISFKGSQCPTGLCQSISHSVSLLIVNEDDVQLVKAQFVAQLDQAIAEGRLQETLEDVNANSNVYILTGLQNPPTAAPQSQSSGLSSGATAGIVLGSIGGVAIIILGLFAIRRRRDVDKEQDAYFPQAISTSQTLATPQDVEGDLGGDGTLGVGQADYRSKASAAALVEGEIADNSVPQDEKGADSSSNAGSSGWSSSVGNSTLNSESIDGIDETTGSSLAAIGAASALAARRGSKDVSGVPVVPEVTREDLDLAIEAGDWAAVGATAALLAAASDSQSASSRSRASTSRGGGSSISSLDAARAAELDHLVDAGDWEGVVVAAAKFESTEDQSKSSASQRTGGSSGAASATLSDSPSKVAKRDAIREEVESLVRRVVPEEIENVDEMMLQFKGREEELVETLRTMQERQVAQKARVQGQKQAKRDARRVAQEGGIAPSIPSTTSSAQVASTPESGGVGAAAAAGVAVGVAAVAGVAAALGISNRKLDESDHHSTTSGSSSDASESFFATSSTQVPSILGGDGTKEKSESSSSEELDEELANKKRRTALELAIEAGDWEAVGEAAAMMSDTSVNSASTGEIRKYAEGDTGSISEHSEDRFHVNADRAAELDEMIDRGDWTGVVEAAARFSSTTTISPTPQDVRVSPQPDVSTPEGIAAAERAKRIREEQEALAQADLWMEIAEQSKVEGSTDAAASDAADWAIARSLSALKSAEAKGELEKQDSDEGSAGSV